MRRFLGVALLLVAPPTAAAQGTMDMDAFDLIDRSAREIIWAALCGQHFTDLARGGRLGPADSLGQIIQCRTGGQDFGLFFTMAPGTTTPIRLDAFTRDGRRYDGPIDTLDLRRRYWVLQNAFRRTGDRYEAANRPAAPFPLKPRGDSLQVWMIPVGIILQEAVGGEIGFRYSADTRTMVRETDAFDKFRPIAVPDTGTVTIESREEALPLLTEVLVANLLNEGGRVVTIVTKRFTSTLAGRGLTAAWIHLPRR